ncbi:Homeobox protein knotted-1-like 1 [Morella rubra]|uniref:Homeobox protein knotted-1-like 1 n=1 Tax=Morella rubra TaxID=262757 RepID=A0A6A1UZZ0_9ROSI|nr:Homeobox protein knotted-1-like 1 [Morella rubra]
MDVQSAEKGGIVDQEEHEEVLVKRMITAHPLYGLLVETHLKCLEVAALGEIGEVGAENVGDLQASLSKLKFSTNTSSSDLDHFMEAFCTMLGRLEEAMEEPMKKTASFISATYIQLNELSGP